MAADYRPTSVILNCPPSKDEVEAAAGETETDGAKRRRRKQLQEKYKCILFVLALIQLVLSLLTAILGTTTLIIAHEWFLAPINADGAGLWAGLLGVAAGALALYLSRNITSQPGAIAHLVLAILASVALFVCSGLSVWWALYLYQQANEELPDGIKPPQTSKIPNEDEIIRRVYTAVIAISIITAFFSFICGIACTVSSSFMCCVYAVCCGEGAQKAWKKLSRRRKKKKRKAANEKTAPENEPLKSTAVTTV